MKGRKRGITFSAHRGYYTSGKERIAREIAAVLDELIELMPNTGAGNDLDNDKTLQREVVTAIIHLNQLVLAKVQ